MRSRFVCAMGVLTGGLLVGSVPGAARAATPVFNDNFNAYTSGTKLSGQGSWTVTGTAVTTPIQVSGSPNQYAAIGTSGEDDYKAFTAPTLPGNVTVQHDDGASITTTLNLNVVAAQATGDYFLHLSNPIATTSNFYQRLFARSVASGSGYVLGLVDTSGTGSTVTYAPDTAALTLGQTYAVAIVWNFVAGGTNNDTFALTVDGAPYLTHTWTSVTAEPASLAEVSLRQGTAANAPTVQVDDLTVTTTATVVPEPASAGLVAAVAAGGLLRRRRAARRR